MHQWYDFQILKTEMGEDTLFWIKNIPKEIIFGFNKTFIEHLLCDRYMDSGFKMSFNPTPSYFVGERPKLSYKLIL